MFQSSTTHPILKVLTISVKLQQCCRFAPVADVLVHVTIVLQDWVVRPVGCAAPEHVHQKALVAVGDQEMCRPESLWTPLFL